MKFTPTILCTVAVFAVAAVANADSGSNDNQFNLCGVVDGLHTGKRPMINVELVKDLGPNEIRRSETERSRLAGRFQLKLDPDPANDTWPYRVVAADLLRLRANSMKLIPKASSGEIVIRRDFKGPVDGGFNPKTGDLWANIAVGFTAESFMEEDDWVIPGEVDAGPEPKPALVTMELSGFVEDDVLTATATIAVPDEVPLFGGSNLTLLLAASSAAAVADVPHLMFNLRLKTVADNTAGTNMVISASDAYTALDEANQIWSQCCIGFGSFGVYYPFPWLCTGMFCIPSDSAFPGSDGNLACATLESTLYPGSDEIEFMLDYSGSASEGVIEVVIVEHLTAPGANEYCLPNAAADGIAWSSGAVVIDTDVSEGVSLAHELGHALGISGHSPDPNNLMSASGSGLELTLDQCLAARDNLFWQSGPDCSY